MLDERIGNCRHGDYPVKARYSVQKHKASTRFHLEMSFDEVTGDPVAAYLRVREGKVSETKEISEGVAFADYQADGLLLGIELLAPCQAAVLERAAENDTEAVRRFLRRGVQKELIVT